ncbi:MAG: PAS domain S-box protein [Gemmatimonadaceae bacterium]|nr:PAS domain S-box protein [Gemmatimonadaceae bacterium]
MFSPPNSLLATPAPAPSLTSALEAIDRAGSTGARVQIAAQLLQDMGFDRVVISLRDHSLNATLIVQAGEAEAAAAGVLPLKPLPGSVWRRRLQHLERFRVGDLYLLDGSDPWVALEFFGAGPAGPGDGIGWLSTDLIIGVMRGPHGDVLGFVKLAGPRDGLRPGDLRQRDLAAIVRHLAARVGHDALEAVARQRHERLQLLQDAGASLTRSLDEQEIMRELARQVQRAVRCDGVAVLVPDLHSDVLNTSLRIVRGVERTRGPVRLGDGIVSEVARTGRPVRVGDREADRAREKAGLPSHLSLYDVVGESGAASSVVAVPVRVGIRLLAVLAVHSTLMDVFTAEDEEVLATMASQAATAMANARRYAESERERRTTEALADVARAVGESLRLGEVLRLILRHSVSLLGVEGACIALRTGDYLHIVAALGAADVLSGVHLPMNASLIGRSVSTNELIVVNEFTPELSLNRSVQHLARIQRTVIAPLVTGRGTIGGISVLNRERPFDQEDAKVLQRLADQVSVAIVNARLFEEIERATQEWKVAFDSTASGIVVLDESFNVSRCNTRAAELCGRTVPELLKTRFRDALVGAGEGADGQALDVFIERALHEGAPVRESVRDLATGRLFTMLAAPHPAGGCVITFDDVTESSRLTEQHGKVLDTVSDAIVITEPGGRIAFANPAAHALFQRANLVGETSAALVPDEWLDVVSAQEAAAQRGERPRYECEVLRRDGTRRRVQVATAPLYELGEIVGSVACLRDVTEQRADAVARERSEQLYRGLIENATDAIFTIDLAGKFTSVNRGMIAETGLTAEQIVGQDYLSLVDPLDRDLAAQEMVATLAGEHRKVQMRCITKQGSRLTMITAAPLHEDGVIAGALCIVRDITNDEILHETHLQQARLAAVGESLGRVANELNNPLTSLLAVAELQVSSPTLGRDDQHALEQIIEEARRASQIVGHLLETTGEAPHTGGQRTAVDINSIARRTLEHHGFSLRAMGVEVHTSFESNLPPVDGDPLQLQQVLSNILGNAEQALGEHAGPRRLMMRTARDTRGIAVRIIDTGPGIAPANTTRVFEPMFTTRAHRGHRGLGLTIAHTIVRDHGGTIELNSTLGEGTSMIVRLPVVAGWPGAPDSGASDDANSVRRASDHRAGESPEHRSAPAEAPVPAARRILVVEDEDTLRNAVYRFLSARGYAVDTADCGAAALELLRGNTYDLILLDLRMRGISGEDVYDTMQTSYPRLASRVVFVTGDLHSASASRFIRLTGRPVIAKPFTLAELEGKVAQLIAQ